MPTLARDLRDPTLQLSPAAPGMAERELGEDISGLFAEGALGFHYQSKVRLGDGVHVGFEALARWRHARLGLVYPETFLPLLEQRGLVVELTRRLLSQVAADLVRWRGEALHPGPVAINLPAVMLSSSLAAREILVALASNGLPPSSLIVEVPEPVLRGSHRAITDRLRELARLGIRLALDDFGTGEATLDQLRGVPFSELKIDCSFIRRIGQDSHGEHIVAAIIRTARDLGMDAVAEGVETQGQRRWLLDHGCRFAQGYLFGRPEPASLAARRIPRPAYTAARQLQQRASTSPLAGEMGRKQPQSPPPPPPSVGEVA